MSLSNQDMVEPIDVGFPQSAKQQKHIVQVLSHLLEPAVLELWFDDGRSIVVQKDQVIFLAENDFQLNRLQSKYWAQIRRAVERVCGDGFPFRLSVKSTENKPTLTTTHSLPAATIEFSATANIVGKDIGKTQFLPNDEVNRGGKKPRKQGIESFWFGASNRLAQAGVSQMFDQLGQISPLVMYGPAGSGKTHLLESLVVEARRKLKLQRCVFLSAEQFTTNFVQSLRGTGLPLFRRKYRDLDLLALDDVQFFAGKNATLAEFQYTIDNLARNGKQVILSSNRPPIDLGKLGSDVTARMMSGLVCPLNYPDAEGRKKILQQMCNQRCFRMPDDVLELISQHLARDVRRLSGAINRIHALSVATNKKVNLDLAKQALTDLFSLNAGTTTLGNIEKVVCDFCGVKPADLKSSSRQKKICAARMLAMYLSRQYTPSAFSEIGDYFGRTHSTVIAAHKKFSSMINNNVPVDLPHAKYLAKDALVQIESSLRIG